MAKKLRLTEKCDALYGLCEEYDVSERLCVLALSKVAAGHTSHGNDAHSIDLCAELRDEFLDVLGYCAIARCRDEWSTMFTVMMAAASTGLRAVEREMENRERDTESEATE